MEITVFTSITGQRDRLLEDQVTEGARYVAFVDRPWKSKIWEEQAAYQHFRSNRRNSRAPKILCHQFIGSPYSIWIDGRICLKVPAPTLIERYLGGFDLAVFDHPKRSCIYDEAAECAQRSLDNPEVIHRQVARYRTSEFPASHGLAECSIIMRRHSRAVEEFNNHWWSEYCRHSVRDQISFMYSVRSTRLKINLIDHTIRPTLFDILPRSAEAEPAYSLTAG